MMKQSRRFGANKSSHAHKFRRDVSRTHPRNVQVRPMRGGWRL